MRNFWLRTLFVLTVVALGSSTSAQERSTNTGSSKSEAGNEKDGDKPSKAETLPSCSYKPAPPYTKEARKAKYEGIVVLNATIEPDGKLSNITVVKSPGLGLDEISVKTLKTWICSPATHDGKPVRTSIPFQFTFRLSDKP